MVLLLGGRTRLRTTPTDLGSQGTAGVRRRDRPCHLRPHVPSRPRAQNSGLVPSPASGPTVETVDHERHLRRTTLEAITQNYVVGSPLEVSDLPGPPPVLSPEVGLKDPRSGPGPWSGETRSHRSRRFTSLGVSLHTPASLRQVHIERLVLGHSRSLPLDPVR